MIWNYITLSFRKFKRQKFYSLLNIFGLSVGMATVILILLYVLDEVNYDRFHRHHKNLYRIVENQYYSGQPVFPVAVTPGPLAESLKSDYPEVELATRVHFGTNTLNLEEERFVETGIYADPDFLEMFDYPILNGDATTALNEINAILITQSLSEKFFGKENALGKTIQVNGNRDVLITAIIKDIPENTHLRFSFIMPMQRRLIEVPSFKDNWGRNGLYTYVKLTDGTSVDQFNQRIKDHIRKKVEKGVTDIYLQPITDVHLGEVNFVADVGGKGNKQYVQIFSVVAAFILIIACINFMNLSTARATKRAKEVGLRKTVGAYRYQLVFQFLGESVMVALIAMAISVLLVDLLLGPFNTLTQKNLSLQWVNNGSLILYFLGASVITGLIAGIYPAFFLSSFQPARVLKGVDHGNSTGGTFRRMLVVVQFSISIIMISGTIVISSQMNYIRSRNLGWDRENLFIVQNLSNYSAFKNALSDHSEVTGVTGANQHPTYVGNSTSGIGWKGKEEDNTVLFHTLGVDHDYIQTMKIGLHTGRTFSKETADTLSVLINEEAMNVLNFENPLGEHLTWGEEVYTIIGVVKDFHFKSVHERIEPLILYIEKGNVQNALIRIEGHAEAAVKILTDEWKAVNPDNVLSYSFLNSDFDRLYRSEAQTGIIFKYFSFLAILISSLGLFGLSSYTLDQKRKEYSIRKIFGASVSRLFFFASRDFVLLVIISFFISLPIAWFWMKQWLQGFAYHVELSPVVFFAAGLIAIVIALITVSYQALKVGFINPVKNLRSE